MFVVSKRRAWDPDTNMLSTGAQRQADVYVFAVLAHSDKATIDPLNANQWQFYVVQTTTLNARTRSQHSITLKSLEKLSGGAVCYSDLKHAIEAVGHEHP